MAHKRFFTKEMLFTQLQTSLVARPNRFDGLKQAVQRRTRLPKSGKINGF